ncbi:MAG: hypothetical protein KA314_12575 [Chloroflexi bacterium]|nr:hypothetical protein [Chloroflexota bacterium]MBP8056671.1 hypothetical protein [Chloroflexota bacterium]
MRAEDLNYFQVAPLSAVQAGLLATLIQEGWVESVTRHRQWQQTLDQKMFLDQVFGQEVVANSD